MFAEGHVTKYCILSPLEAELVKISINGLMYKETLQVIHAFESHYCPEELEDFSVTRIPYIQTKFLLHHL